MKRSLTIAGTLLVVACAAGPGPGDSGYAYNLEGAYTGRLMVEGMPFDATFDLRTTGAGHVYGTFRVERPLEVEGELSGRILDDLLRVTVSWLGSGDGAPDCTRVVEGILTIGPGGAVVDGPVTISDCGDTLSGRLSFRRTAPGTPQRP